MARPNSVCEIPHVASRKKVFSEVKTIDQAPVRSISTPENDSFSVVRISLNPSDQSESLEFPALDLGNLRDFHADPRHFHFDRCFVAFPRVRGEGANCLVGTCHARRTFADEAAHREHGVGSCAESNPVFVRRFGQEPD